MGCGAKGVMTLGHEKDVAGEEMPNHAASQRALTASSSPVETERSGMRRAAADQLPDVAGETPDRVDQDRGERIGD